jgi:hypothetical protein
MADQFLVSRDAFSSGQISSKLWLCSQLERMQYDRPQIIWLYGGWHAMTGMLLLARQIMPISHIRSFDVDPSCESTADSLMENWIWQGWKFKAFTRDCNSIDPISGEYGPPPDIVINTSTEHFHSRDWYDRIPSGTMMVLQSNNMPHDDHHDCYDDLESFVSNYGLSPMMYKGQLDFNYPTWNFSRYMIIGRKNHE